MVSKITDVFVDMDGVLFDFVKPAVVAFLRGEGAAEDACQHMAELIIEQWPPGVFDMADVLKAPIGKIWGRIDKSPEFWDTLKLLPYAKEVIEAASEICQTVRLLSSPSSHPNSHSGKKVLQKSHFRKLKLLLVSEKHLLAAPGRLLIDDYDKNVNEWRAAGGEAILFPQIWNSNHAYRKDAMLYLRDSLDLHAGRTQ